MFFSRRRSESLMYGGAYYGSLFYGGEPEIGSTYSVDVAETITLADP